MKLLVVEDEDEMGALLAKGLIAEGYEVDRVANGIDGLISAGNTHYSAAIVDVMLPGMSGFEFCRRMRAQNAAVPILLLTARDAVDDRVKGLDAGADDYLTKPFAFAELTARIRALLRRETVGPHIALSIGSLTIDSHNRKASVGGQPLSLSPKEFDLLRLLADKSGSVLSRTEILDDVWGRTEHIDANVVDQYVSYLRRKIDPLGSDVSIATRRGIGYGLEVTA
ncbi:response regulator transcription factor [Subtercola vilae]|uniref:DNA-binding response regulator n=1 Tax=Subtercola vilae TaxID=2056433 RepID=A0A4T2C7C5_9MICO|nr:response regulator transcription factor [Subtercola vilae]MEA9986835.1 response regulator transcription factor [Subtercola sp. RTI3]TIH40353.1 DNA-binding response regulator [Subtercola vilae]